MIIKRFFFWTFLSFIAIGIAMHFEMEMPNIVGRIPGDVVLYNKKMTIHAPIASAAIVGMGITALFAAIFSKRK